ncbi:MAG: hypothetical protein U9N45_04295 [Gemmatimonadota bacterium]|nr:hypothetical protein [Gemmatimonadota bacterium]
MSNKTIGRSIFVSLITLVSFAACTTESNPFVPSNNQAILRLSGIGGCDGGKTELASGRDDELLVTVEEGLASFTHSNALFNCCMDSLTLEMSVTGRVVRVVETEHCGTPCKCICGYTVYGELEGLEPGVYTLEICPDMSGKTVFCSVVFRVEDKSG